MTINSTEFRCEVGRWFLQFLPRYSFVPSELMNLSSFHRKLSQDILNVSVQGIAVTAQMWTDRTTVSLMVRTLEAVDLCTPGTRFPRILAPWVFFLTLELSYS